MHQKILHISNPNQIPLPSVMEGLLSKLSQYTINHRANMDENH